MPFTNLLQTIPPIVHILSAFDAIEDIIRDTVHNEVLDRLIVVFPSHIGFDTIDVTTIDICLGYRGAGQMILPVAHTQGDVESVMVHDPVGAIGS